MKYIIDIPDKTIAHIRADYGHNYKGLCDEDRDIIVKEIYNGVPLEDIKEQYDKGYKDGVKETFIEELEKIKAELNNKSFAYSLTDNFENDIIIGVIKVSDMEKIIDKHISELKGENNAE